MCGTEQYFSNNYFRYITPDNNTENISGSKKNIYIRKQPQNRVN